VRGADGTSGGGGGRVEAVDTDEAFDVREPPDNRFSDFREGVRGNEENRFKFAPSVVRRSRGEDEGLACSPISVIDFGGEREVERLKRLVFICPWLPSVDIATASSEVGDGTRGMPSTMMLTQLSSFLNSA
jgi:hypothetical protein